jgi:hypothetical protein
VKSVIRFANERSSCRLPAGRSLRISAVGPSPVDYGARFGDVVRFLAALAGGLVLTWVLGAALAVAVPAYANDRSSGPPFTIGSDTRAQDAGSVYRLPVSSRRSMVSRVPVLVHCYPARDAAGADACG